jgi:hypothetical protein
LCNTQTPDTVNSRNPRGKEISYLHRTQTKQPCNTITKAGLGTPGSASTAQVEAAGKPAAAAAGRSAAAPAGRPAAAPAGRSAAAAGRSAAPAVSTPLVVRIFNDVGVASVTSNRRVIQRQLGRLVFAKHNAATTTTFKRSIRHNIKLEVMHLKFVILRQKKRDETIVSNEIMQ